MAKSRTLPFRVIEDRWMPTFFCESLANCYFGLSLSFVARRQLLLSSIRLAGLSYLVCPAYPRAWLGLIFDMGARSGHVYLLGARFPLYQHAPGDS